MKGTKDRPKEALNSGETKLHMKKETSLSVPGLMQEEEKKQDVPDPIIEESSSEEEFNDTETEEEEE